MKCIPIRKEPNGAIYIGDNIDNFDELHMDQPPYNFIKTAIPDGYDDFAITDFNDDLSFSIEKYTDRKQRETSAKYEALIVSKIREKYSLNQELAILRQRDAKPEEFAEYNVFVEEIKKDVKQLIYGGSDNGTTN